MAGIEELIERHIKALEANTAALLGKGGAAASSTGAATGGGKAAGGKGKDKSEPKINQDQMNAALIKLKDKFGMDESKAVIKEHGKVDKMAEIKPAQYEAVYTAAVSRYEELENGTGSEEDDGL
jgi:hypothetical protein